MAVYLKVPQMSEQGLPTLFLDRDGVLIIDRHYLADPQDVTLITGVCEALRKAQSAGYILVGVSNQSGIGRGLFTLDDFQKVMARMEELLAAQGICLDGFYYCPHDPNERCNCRKPFPGLLEEARKDFNWDPAKSWVVGDKLSDVKLGRNNHMGGVLVETGHGMAEKSKVEDGFKLDSRVAVAPDLEKAITFILNHQDPEEGS